MAENKDLLAELIGGLPYVQSAWYEPVQPPYTDTMPPGSLTYFANFLQTDDTVWKAAIHIAPDVFSDPDKNVSVCSNMQFVINQSRAGVPQEQIRQETPPPPPEPVLEEPSQP